MVGRGRRTVDRVERGGGGGGYSQLRGLCFFGFLPDLFIWRCVL